MAEDRNDEGHVGLPVMCRRLGRTRTVAEHLSCPYCFGGEGEVTSGDRACFCDFDPDSDAVVFGFPETFGHLARG